MELDGLNVTSGSRLQPPGLPNVTDPTANRLLLVDTLKRITIKRTDSRISPSGFQARAAIEGQLPPEWAMFRNLEYMWVMRLV